MSDLDGLLVFAKVVEANGFSAAARRLRMPVATVSRRVADLEHRLGVRLLERTTRKLRLTDAGAELLACADQTAALQEAVLAIARDRAESVSGLLRIAAPPSIAATLITPICCAFQAVHPQVRFQVFITERLVDLIADGVDVAFHVGDLKSSGVIAKRVLSYRHRVLASPEYLRAAEPLRTPGDLTQHRLLAFVGARTETLWRFTHSGRRSQQTVRFQPHLSMNDYAGIAYAIAAGVGIGELPPIVEPALVQEGRLVEVLPKWHLRTHQLSLLHAGDRYTSKAVRSFKDFAAQRAAELFPSLPV